MKTIFKVSGFIAIAILFSLSTNAQPFGMGQNPEVFAEVQEYVTSNIFPVLSEKRTDFNDELSAEEIEQINDLIAQLETIREELGFPIGMHQGMGQGFKQGKGFGKGHKKGNGQGFGCGNCDGTGLGQGNGENFEQMQEFHEQIKEIMLQAKEISDNHITEIEAIMTELEPQKEIWKSDIEQIFSDHGIDIENIENHRAKMRKNFQSEECEDLRPEEFNPFERMFLPHVFVLMDYNNNLLLNSELKSVSIFPNPATENFTIDFELEETASITLKIMDNSGNLVEQIDLGDLSVGTYEKEINSSAYNKGIYFVVIETETGKTTRKVIIKN